MYEIIEQKGTNVITMGCDLLSHRRVIFRSFLRVDLRTEPSYLKTHFDLQGTNGLMHIRHFREIQKVGN
jgi:hypothetical protein